MSLIRKHGAVLQAWACLDLVQHIIQVRLNICPICQQASESPMQRTMLAAVQAIDEELIAPRYLMRISAHLAFSSSAQKGDSHWGPRPDCMAGVRYGMTSTAMSPYLIFINDVTVTSS